jgi:hypothetical protein
MTDTSEKKRSPLSKMPRSAAEIDQLGISLFGAEKWDKHRANLDREAAKRKALDAKARSDNSLKGKTDGN